MFDFLKSIEVHKVGKELFKQISTARDILNDDTFEQRINSMFSAGYMAGFILPKLSYLFKDKKLKRKYLKKVLSGIFPSSGIKSYDIRLYAYDLGKSIIENKNNSLTPEYLNKVAEDVNNYELGFDSGKNEVFAWEADANYIPHLLLDYLRC